MLLIVPLPFDITNMLLIVVNTLRNERTTEFSGSSEIIINIYWLCIKLFSKYFI